MEGESNNTILLDCIYLNFKHGHGREHFWISGILLSIVGAIGLVGNVFTLIVLWQPKMRKILFYNLLIALACFDTLFILSYGVRVSYHSLDCYPEDTILGSLANPLLAFTKVGSIYMTVVISLERYLGICHPHFKFTRRAWVFIVPVFLISLIFTVPKLMERKFDYVNGSLIVEVQKFTRDENYKQAYYVWAHLVCVFIIPVGALLFFNESIIARIVVDLAPATVLSPSNLPPK